MSGVPPNFLRACLIVEYWRDSCTDARWGDGYTAQGESEIWTLGETIMGYLGEPGFR